MFVQYNRDVYTAQENKPVYRRHNICLVVVYLIFISVGNSFMRDDLSSALMGIDIRPTVYQPGAFTTAVLHKCLDAVV